MLHFGFRQTHLPAVSRFISIPHFGHFITFCPSFNAILEPVLTPVRDPVDQRSPHHRFA